MKYYSKYHRLFNSPRSSNYRRFIESIKYRWLSGQRNKQAWEACSDKAKKPFQTSQTMEAVIINDTLTFRDRAVHPTRPGSCPVFPDHYAGAYRGRFNGEKER